MQGRRAPSPGSAAPPGRVRNPRGFRSSGARRARRYHRLVSIRPSGPLAPTHAGGVPDISRWRKPPVASDCTAHSPRQGRRAPSPGSAAPAGASPESAWFRWLRSRCSLHHRLISFRPSGPPPPRTPEAYRTLAGGASHRFPAIAPPAPAGAARTVARIRRPCRGESGIRVGPVVALALLAAPPANLHPALRASAPTHAGGVPDINRWRKPPDAAIPRTRPGRGGGCARTHQRYFSSKSTPARSRNSRYSSWNVRVR